MSKVQFPQFEMYSCPTIYLCPCCRKPSAFFDTVQEKPESFYLCKDCNTPENFEKYEKEYIVKDIIK
jgi:hypothetical protein